MILSSTLFVVVVIGLLIFVHELGHLLAAKRSKIPVERFSIGFGPALIHWKIKETTYCISLIPLGGYIKLSGEDEETPGGFLLQPLKKKLLVVLAGPFFNFILGLLVTFLIYLSFGVKFAEPRIDFDEPNLTKSLPIQRKDLIIRVEGETIPSFGELERKLGKWRGKEVEIELVRGERHLTLFLPADTVLFYIRPFVRPIVERVKRNSPAEKAGLKPMDELLMVDNKEIVTWDDFTKIVREAGEKPIFLTWRRGRETLAAEIKPELVSDELGKKRIGKVGLWVYLPKKMPSLLSSLWIAGQRTVYVCIQTVVIIYKVIVGEIPRRAIGGPVMIAQLTYEGVAWGWEYILSLIAALSLNLFVINLLPIPVVDGGRSLLFLVEKVRGKRWTKKGLERAFFIGYAIIIAIALFAFFNDMRRIFQR